MAKDTLNLLKWIGWEKDRSIHLFGVSMGGMIAQEMTRSIIAAIKTAFKLVTGDRALDLYLELLFPDGYFDESTEKGRLCKSRLRDRLRTCHQLPREQSRTAYLGHFYAVMMHHFSYEKLKKISADLHPAKILVIIGDKDELILAKRAVELHEHLPGSELFMVENAGHALGYQITEELNSIMDRVMAEGNAAFSKHLLV